MKLTAEYNKDKYRVEVLYTTDDNKQYSCVYVEPEHLIDTDEQHLDYYEKIKNLVSFINRCYEQENANKTKPV